LTTEEEEPRVLHETERIGAVDIGQHAKRVRNVVIPGAIRTPTATAPPLLHSLLTSPLG
jgi:hypothetical protein